MKPRCAHKVSMLPSLGFGAHIAVSTMPELEMTCSRGQGKRAWRILANVRVNGPRIRLSVYQPTYLAGGSNLMTPFMFLKLMRARRLSISHLLLRNCHQLLLLKPRLNVLLIVSDSKSSFGLDPHLECEGGRARGLHHHQASIVISHCLHDSACLLFAVVSGRD